MIIDKEIFRKVELIRINTRQSVTSLFAGEFESAFRGSGLEFEEVREYLPGDEIRSIDWNVTARTGFPHVKRFREERELSIFFLVDLSSSSNFGSLNKTRNETAAEIVSVLSFSSNMNNDRTGLLLFTDRTELFIPLSKGMTHTLHMVRELLTFRPEGKKTDIGQALEYLGKITTRRSVVFLISDFYDSNWLKHMKITAGRHDLVNLYLYDPFEKELPKAGLVDFTDSESGEKYTLDTSDRKVRTVYRERFETRLKSLKEISNKYGADFIDIDISREYIHKLSQFFISRGKRKQ